jgi:hypothetical protein
MHQDYAALRTPRVGTRLATRRVAVLGLGAVAVAAERLADCGVLHWQVGDSGPLPARHPWAHLAGREWSGKAAHTAFAGVVQAKSGAGGDWQFGALAALTEASYAEIRAALAPLPPDLLLGGGDAAALALLHRLARDLDVPAVGVALLAGSVPHALVNVTLPGAAGAACDPAGVLQALGGEALDPARATATPEGWLDWQTANGHAAAIARMLLLAGSRFAPTDLTGLVIGEGRTAVLIGSTAWPWHVAYCKPADLIRGQSAIRNPQAALDPVVGAIPGPVMIVGCGSLGSQVARTLVAAGAAHDLILVDPAPVTTADLVSEFYRADQVGQNKADALAASLMRLVPAAQASGWIPSVFADGWNGALTANAHWSFLRVSHRPGRYAHFGALLTDRRPALVVLTTGGVGDAALADLLRERGIPHIVGRCDTDVTHYAAVVVNGAQGPCFHCLGGDLLAPAQTGTPGTMVETGRAADLIARLAWQLGQRPTSHAAWFRTLLAAGQGALVGGNTVGRVRLLPPAPGTPPPTTYGITLPGQVVAQPAAGPCPECAA